MNYLTIGNGILYHGDALALMRAMPSESVDMIWTDPPYDVISGGNASAIARGEWGGHLRPNDGKIFKHNDIKPSEYMPEFYRVLKPGTHCYVMINNKNLRALLNAANDAGFGFHNLLDWQKNNANANRWYMKTKEPVLFFHKKPAKTINFPGSKDSFACDNIRGKWHPTQKPVELMRHHIENSSQPGEIIFDPFSGSGATLVAAQQSGRRWIGCELDTEFYMRSCGFLWGAAQ